MNFTNLEQRMAHAYLEVFPLFVPLKDCPVSVQSQEQFYSFMKNVFQTIFDTPERFFKKLNQDDAFPNRFNRASYGKPKLNETMKKDLKEIDELLALLFTLGQNSTVENGRLLLSAGVEIKKKFLNILPELGLTLDDHTLSCAPYAGLFPTWQWLATRQNASVTTFSRAMFDPAYPYTQEIYATLFGNQKAFATLVQHLGQSGYQRVDLRRGPYTLDYVKRIVEKDVPVGTPMHGDPYHYGVSADYRPDAAVPQYLVLRILEMKNILLEFDALPNNLKDFVIQYVKKCDDCGYCTQTDKTGKRQPLHITVTHHGEHCVCPLYPGFNFCFTQLDDALVANLMAFLDVMDRRFTGSPSPN